MQCLKNNYMEQIFKGPEIKWNKDDIRAMVDAFGLNETVERLSHIFQKKYAHETILTILAQETHVCPECGKTIHCTEEVCNYSTTFKLCLECLAKRQ